MKTVKITVDEDQTIYTITETFDGDVMTEELDEFIVDHVGGRPNDRK